MSLALATLIHEWRRYQAAVIALAFSGVLILALFGLISGLVRSITATLDRSRADLIIMPPKVESIFGPIAIELPGRIAPQIYLSPEVRDLSPWELSGADWRNIPGPGNTQRRVYVLVSMVDPAPNAITLPRDFSKATMTALQEPLSVVVDRSALGALGVKVGDMAILRGQTVVVRGAVEGYASVQSPQVFVSRDSMIRLGLMSQGDRTGPLLVRLEDPAKAVRVRDALNARANGDYRAWLPADLSRANERAFMEEQIIGIVLGFSFFLSVLIGLGITSQTLRGAIASNIREFASLRALGVSMSALRGVVLELSFWVGVAGLVATAGLMAGVLGLARITNVTMALSPGFVALVSGMLMIIAMVSGFLSLGALARSQPAELLR
jgi:putative ABC transport system permease protein